MISRPALGAELDLNISGASVGPYDVCPGATIYWQGVRQRRVLLRHCADCQRYSHPRQESCEGCFGPNLSWVEVSGAGEVYTFSTVHRAPDDRPTPYTLGMVRLDEGVFLFAEIEPPDSVQIGMRVEPFFVGSADGTLLKFRVSTEFL
jgi:uncharacterized protein